MKRGLGGNGVGNRKREEWKEPEIEGRDEGVGIKRKRGKREDEG